MPFSNCSAKTSVLPYHSLRIWLSVMTVRWVSAANASRMNVFPAPLGPTTVMPAGARSGSSKRRRSWVSRRRRPRNPTTSAIEWSG